MTDRFDIDLPAVGFGTYKLNGRDGADVIAQAARTGYRLFDSAFNYENEGTVGAGLRASGVPRDELIVTSKLPGRHHQYDQALRTIEESVYRVGLDHLDLYLIHWPNPSVDLYVEAWQALIEAQQRGLVRWIGVSNFLPEHLERLVSETHVVPAVNQIEMHPYFPQAEQRGYDTQHGIVTEAWSPLGRANEMMEDPVLRGIATQHGVSVAQVILRWQTLLGVVPLPKASSPERQRQNLDLERIDLTEDDLLAIDALARPDGRVADQDPAVHEEM